MPERVRAPQRGLASMGAVFRLCVPRTNSAVQRRLLYCFSRDGSSFGFSVSSGLVLRLPSEFTLPTIA